VAITCWTLFGLVSGLEVWISMITHGHNVPLLIGHYMLVWWGWVPLTFLVIRFTERRPLIPPSAANVLAHFLGALVVAVIHVSYWTTLTQVMQPFDRLTASWSSVVISEALFFRLPLEIILYFVVAGLAHGALFYQRSRQLERSLMNARLHALELQIQPHFLFNTLNTIAALVRTERNKEAVSMIAGLSDLLRYVLDHAGQQMVSLEDEKEMLQRYLEIQRTRFADRLTYTIEVGDDVRRAAVPVFILQPLAENAIRHGVAQSSSAGVVNVSAFRVNGHLRIEMFNSGRVGDSNGLGIGLRNTRERLEQLFGADQQFDLREARGGVVASITMPFRETA